MADVVGVEAQKIGIGKHFCSIYKNKEECFLSAISFLTEGLRDNYKCVYVVEGDLRKEMMSAFDKGGFNIDKYLESKQLELLTKEETYLKNGAFEETEMLRLIEEMERTALEDGYKGIFGGSEMSWVLDSGSDEKKVVEYESKLNDLVLNHEISLICQYDENKFSFEVLNNIVRTHPYLYIYGKMYENKYFYTDPKYMESGVNVFPAESYRMIIETIIEG